MSFHSQPQMRKYRPMIFSLRWLFMSNKGSIKLWCIFSNFYTEGGCAPLKEKQHESQTTAETSVNMGIKNELETNPHYLSDNPIDNQKWEAYESNHNNIPTG